MYLLKVLAVSYVGSRLVIRRNIFTLTILSHGEWVIVIRIASLFCIVCCIILTYMYAFSNTHKGTRTHARTHTQGVYVGSQGWGGSFM